MSGNVQFAISLEDHVSSGAKTASRSLRELQNDFTSSKTKLGHLQGQLSQAKNLGDVEGYRKYSKLVEEARKETFRLGDALTAAGGPMRKLGSTSKTSGDSLEKFGSKLAEIATVAAAIEFGKRVAGELEDIGIAALKTAFEVNEVNEKLVATFDALGVNGPASGKKTLAMLDSLSSKLPQTRDQLAEWTKEYQALGMTDLGEIRAQVYATAAAQAIGGEQGAAAYEALTRRVNEAIEAHHGLKLAEKSLTSLYKAGVNVTDVASRMSLSTQEFTRQLKAGTLDAQKFGAALETSLIVKGKGPLAAMGNSLGTLKAKGLEVFGHLFDGIDLKPVTDAIKSFIHLGDEGTASGAALHKGIGGAMQKIINWMGKALVEGEILFLSLELWAIKHRHGIADLAKIFGLVGDAILKVMQYVEKLSTLSPGGAWVEVLKVLAAPISKGASLSLPTVGKTAATDIVAPAHARGGLVGRPAAGEAFASVAPGEFILPRRETREMLGGGIGATGRSMIGQAAANTNAGRAVHIERIIVQAPQGITDAQQLTVTGLAIALERMQLAGGR